VTGKILAHYINYFPEQKQMDLICSKDLYFRLQTFEL
jgi:hypothetical protein